MKKRKMMTIASLLSVAFILASCNSSTKPTSTPSVDSTPISEEEKPEKREATVFVMAGQSNMEGNTYYDNGKGWLRSAFEELGIDDGDVCFNGIPEVMTSFYGTGYGELGDVNQIHASNKENKIAGKFLPTKVGMGHTDDMFGPELGAAYVLKDYATEENPIYFIKCASGGSGFAQSGTKLNWDVTKEGNLYEEHFKKYVQNNLDLIEEETGLKPTIRGFMWHQGCSDTEATKISMYKERMNNLLNQFKSDFEEYAPEEDKSQIAFIDAYIYDGPNRPGSLSLVEDLNAVKKEISEENEMSFIVNSSHIYEDGMALNIATSGWGDVEGANGQLHYKTPDAFKLGMGYGKIIAEEILAYL